MAASTAFTRLFINGTTEAVAVYAVYGVTAADTVSVAADFVKASSGYWVSSTGTVTTATASASGTTLTIPSGPSVDDGYLFVFGSRVQTLASP